MSDRLIYMPLGGAGEIGMNAYVYGYGAPGKERLIVVDLGVTFPDMDSTPGVDLLFPDRRKFAPRMPYPDSCSFVNPESEWHSNVLSAIID